MIDLWYGNKPDEVDYLDIFWNDLNGGYSGNLYKGGKMIGDYTSDDLSDIEKAFPQLEYRERNVVD